MCLSGILSLVFVSVWIFGVGMVGILFCRFLSFFVIFGGSMLRCDDMNCLILIMRLFRLIVSMWKCCVKCCICCLCVCLVMLFMLKCGRMSLNY